MEIWKIAPSAIWLEVSDAGRVRRAVPGGRNKRPGVLRGYRNHNGYIWLKSFHFGQCIHIGVHTLVCETFHGFRPSDGHETAHGNGVRDDNRAENLRWATKAENAADKVAHGNQVGETHPLSKISEDDVREIRRLKSSGVTGSELAGLFGINKHHANKIAAGKAWAHVSLP